jgi:uncharacterized protein (DUF2344 family)
LDPKDYRLSYIHWYFSVTINTSESECLTYIKTKLENKININLQVLQKEIKSGKHVIILKNKAKKV